MKTNLIINKCWNILKVVSDSENYVPKFVPIIEKELLPLFSLIEHVEKVDFEEEIVLVISSFIRATKVVTPVMVKMFPFYKNIFIKQDCIYG